MKTKQTHVTGKVDIWAIPRTEWELERAQKDDPEASPFVFSLRTQAPYVTGAVKLHSEDVAVWLPSGIDLLTKAVDTLREAMAEERKAADARLGVLQKQLNNLLLLEHQDAS